MVVPTSCIATLQLRPDDDDDDGGGGGGGRADLVVYSDTAKLLFTAGADGDKGALDCGGHVPLTLGDCDRKVSS